MPAWLPPMATLPAGTCLRGRGQARRGEFRRQPAQIRKAGGEAHEVDHVFGGGVQLDHALRREAGVARHVFQVGPVFAAVADRDLHASRLGAAARAVAPMPGARAPGASISAWVRRRGSKSISTVEIGGMQIENAAHALQSARQPSDLAVRFERDFLAEGDQEGAVAGRPDGHVFVMLAPESDSGQAALAHLAHAGRPG